MHYILKCVADALFMDSLNQRNSNVYFKEIAEVDAAGRYILSPLVYRWLTMPSRTPLGGISYLPTALVSLCLFIYAGFLRALRDEPAEARYPAFLFVVNKKIRKSVRFWASIGHNNLL